MKKILLILILSIPLLLLLYLRYGDSLRYPNEIRLAYKYIDSNSQKTIKNSKIAQVEEYAPSRDLEIMDEETDSLVNIKYKEVLRITFKTLDDGNLGPIVVYIDKNTNDVLGVGTRK